MALEFNCPYCKAIIRVPDATAGKRGKCPKCASRITIPKLGVARRAGEEQPFFLGPPEPDAIPAPAESGADDDVVFKEYDPHVGVGIDPVVEAMLAPGDVALPIFPGEPSSNLPRPVMHIPDSVMSKVKTKRSSAWVWIVVACIVLGGGGAAGFVAWYQVSTTLAGELTAKLVENPHLPAVIIPRSDIELPPADVNKILDRLQRNPVPLISTKGLATVQLQGSDRGLLISIGPGSATSMYRVEITGDKKLNDYRRDHAADFNRFRAEELSLAVNEFFRTLKRLYAKEGTSRELGQYRDSVGLAAALRGLGYFVDAVHQRQVYQCVYEDDDALYFLLPAGVKRFELIGKSRKGSGVFFPGKYQVRVEGSITLDVATEEEPPPQDEKPKGADTEDKGMSERDDDEPEMPEKK